MKGFVGDIVETTVVYTRLFRGSLRLALEVRGRAVGLRTDGPEASEKLYALKWFFNPWSAPQRPIPISARGHENRCQIPDTVVGSKDKTENSTDTTSLLRPLT